MGDLLKRISSGKAVVGVIGLGYVGLPLSVLFARKFKVVGYDIDRRLIRDLTRGVTNIEDVPQTTLVACLGKSFFPTTNKRDLDGCDVFVICVPAYLSTNRVPNLDALRGASATVKRFLRNGSLVILQTTTFPGTTDSILVPILEER